MEETTGAPSSFAALSPRRLRASSRDGGGVVNRPPSHLTMLLSRHTRRRAFNALFAIAFTTPRLVLAQERAKLARIGYLGLAPAAGYAPRVDALRAGLRDLGYIEGRNLSFEFRWAETPQQMPKLAAELVSAEVDVIFTPTSMETGAALETTRADEVIECEGESSSPYFGALLLARAFRPAVLHAPRPRRRGDRMR